MNIDERIRQLSLQRSQLKGEGDFLGAVQLQLELMDLLVQKGVPPEELASAHNYASVLYLGSKLLASAEWHARRSLDLRRGDSDNDCEARGTYNLVLAQILASGYQFDEAVVFGEKALSEFGRGPWHNPPDDFLNRVIAQVESMRNHTWSKPS